jgi:NADH-quinone oxidoreductase subunit M
LARRLPWLAFFLVVFTFSSIGLPGLNGFAGELLILLGIFQRAWGSGSAVAATSLQVIAVLAVLGVVLGAWYMLWMVQRVLFGPLREPSAVAGHAVHDLTRREIVALAPLAVLVVWIGVQPGYFLQRMAPTLDRVVVVAQDALQQGPVDPRATLGGGATAEQLVRR